LQSTTTDLARSTRTTAVERVDRLHSTLRHDGMVAGNLTPRSRDTPPRPGSSVSREPYPRAEAADGARLVEQ
jgi:hypothetical protein